MRNLSGRTKTIEIETGMELRNRLNSHFINQTQIIYIRNLV